MTCNDADMHGKEIMRFLPLPRTNKYEDVAEEYSIRSAPQADSGLIVYGKYRGLWEANPSMRPVVRFLLEEIRRLQNSSAILAVQNRIDG